VTFRRRGNRSVVGVQPTLACRHRHTTPNLHYRSLSKAEQRKADPAKRKYRTPDRRNGRQGRNRFY
jgi:hypothetical protein